MFRPLFFVPLPIALVLLQQVPTTSGTVDIAIVTGAGVLALTAAETTALAAVAALGVGAKLAGIGLGAGIGAGVGGIASLLSRPRRGSSTASSTRGYRRRGK